MRERRLWGVFHPLRFFVLLLLATAALSAETSLEAARRAQSLLGPETWSRVIRVENETRGSRYPRLVHALVFELADILWFYTDFDGTQSLSLRRGELERDKRDLGPLLREIEPGFVRWTTVESTAETAPLESLGPLRNGCFVESVAALRERLQRGVPVRAPRLLSYYAKTSLGLKGHTVLAYEIGDRVEIFDPGRPREPIVFAAATLGSEALALARALEGYEEIIKARYLPLAV